MEEDTECVRITRSMARRLQAIPIPIAISIWMQETRSPNQAFQATLDSAPERDVLSQRSIGIPEIGSRTRPQRSGPRSRCAAARFRSNPELERFENEDEGRGRLEPGIRKETVREPVDREGRSYLAPLIATL